MKKIYFFLLSLFYFSLFSQNNFHDTQGSIDINEAGQLQFTLPIALPPGVKSVAPQVNLIYSGKSNSIAGYGWNLSGITSISRMTKTIEHDGGIKGLQLNNNDYYNFNGQRLILKQGSPVQYGQNGAEYVTEKYSNIKIKSFGSITGLWTGPEYFEVTFEDGSQAWYGALSSGASTARTPIEYNIVKWKDAQGNYITYNYTLSDNVSAISSIHWGGNEVLGKSHFNSITFTYTTRELKEVSYVNGIKFLQNKLLNDVRVVNNGTQFKRYQITHISEDGYPKVSSITEYNSQNQAANPTVFNYQVNPVLADISTIEHGIKNTHTKKYGDFNYDGITDFIEMENNGVLSYKSSVYKDTPAVILSYNTSEFSPVNFREAVIISYKKNDIVGDVAAIVIPVTKVRPSTNIWDYEFRIYTINLQTKKLDFQYSKILNYEDYKIYGEPDQSTNCSVIPSRLKRMFTYDYDGDGISELILDFSFIRTCYDFGDPEIPRDPREISFNLNSVNNTIVNHTSVGKTEEDKDYFLINGFILNSDNTEIPFSKDGHTDKERSVIDSLEVDKSHIQRQNRLLPPNTDLQYITHYENSSILFDLKQETPYTQSFYKFNHNYNLIPDKLETADFNGDGIEELYTQDSSGTIKSFYNITKSSSGQYHVSSVLNSIKLSGLANKMLLGDFNGDGKVDIAVPQTNKGNDWKFYMATGKGFEEHSYNNFIYYSSEQEFTDTGRHNTFFESGCDYATITYYHYNVTDLNQDGKSEIVVTKVVIRNHEWNSHNDKENTTVSLSVYSSSKPFNIPSIGSTTLPFSYGLTKTSEKRFENKVIPFSTLFINRNNHQIILVGRPDDCPTNNCNRDNVVYLDYKHLPTGMRMASIIQGGLKTDVEYAELLPGTVYNSAPTMVYPFMTLNKINQSYVVSRLHQEGRYQDFRYKGLVTHLQGRGMVGFRQTARSSWYASGFENTKTWSGVEIDPLRESIPVKEWSIKTNNESLVFPTNISLTNTQLLSVKLTDYKTDYFVNGIKKTSLTATEKPLAVMAMVPTTTTSKDFLKDIKTVDIIEYDNYYLPTKTISKVNDNFATSTTTLDYFPPNLTGTGSNYYVGRPRSKTELRQAYGDSKGAKEEYTYENNLLKTKTNWNNNNTEWIRETYAYDGFGNITSKTLSNNKDSNTKITTATYDAAGRFVTKKKETAGSLSLETNITYNNWGQILTQTDAFGVKITNTYDGWGKLLTANHNLGGTTTYLYEKLSNADVKVTQTAADGNISISYTNKIGQNYKSTTKGFASGSYVSKTIQFDILGRKIRESEPYTEGQSPNQWNIIEYDDYSRPKKATSFTGKIVENTYAGRVTTVTETNANSRFKKQTTDPLGNINSTEDKGGIIYFKYNAAGQNTEAKYDTNIVTTKYDNWGRKSEFYDPSNGLYQYEYNDGFGQLTKEISPKGYKQYTYNNTGQLITQREVTTDGTGHTDKTISYTYSTKGLLTKKSGTSKGKAFSTTLTYDTYGRVLSTTENSNGKAYAQQGVIYDTFGRVSSYEKRITSGSVITKAVIENIYHPWSGELYQVKDKTAKKILWELKQTNVKGQVTQALLGATTINNLYDSNGFLSNVSHISSNQSTVLQVSYSFNAIKNELNSRTRGGDFNILESFVYDANNRLINWSDPVTNNITNGANRNVYDAKGRITQNDQLGSIKFENNQYVYRPTSVTLNATGLQNYTNDLVQNIVYNENNDPVFINGEKGDVRFEYGLTQMRQMATYGGNFSNTGEGKFTKFYSENGSFEVIKNNQTGQEKHLLYIGGTPYEANIVYLKDYTESSGSFKFLHKDYLGSVLAITNEAGKIVEQRHFDAWGSFTHLKIGNNAIITDKEQIRDYLSNGNLIVDRGYTSHEHFAEVGIIHMNGRLYDPLLRRFLNADENIQDPHNTQNYNKYGYVLNNPLMYNDPSGEFLAFLGVSAFWKAVIIGATVGLASYTLGLAVTGNIAQWNIGGALKSTFFGAVGGATSFGIGSIFSVAGEAGRLTAFADNLKKSIGSLGLAVIQGGTHAISQGVLGLMQGGDFVSSAVAGFAGSLGASGWTGVIGTSGGAMIAFGALSGGIGAELTGGNFWQGALIGGVVAGLNHAMHRIGNGEDPPSKKYRFPRTKVSFKVDQGAALFIEEDNKRFFDVDIYTVKGTITLDEGVLTINAVGATTTTQVSPYFFGTVTVMGSSAYGLSTFSVSLPLNRDYGYTALQSGYQQIGSTTYTLPKGTTNVNVSIKAGYIFNMQGKGVGTPFPPTTSYNYHFGNGPSINQYPLFK
ncbi:RHS repeat-associated core domain-containing protein [Elizabethkingia sp. JS20170427COW]|uniref:RHS repeat-associated core domain-containing protein n=1 Tax=Elizabethkingia sp. JS20170427COW TaxID=2583851 RepID=UPI0011107198|nr:RHS repeat-associated core domain-containing protein [Elizabethkingia sp. JS20170427COW]QCX53038.1 hypothetical protein FGE20_04480 [Elizabethkingia sp. JS20170427COW]